MRDQPGAVTEPDPKLASDRRILFGLDESEVHDAGFVEGQGDLAWQVDPAHAFTVLRCI